MDLKVKMGEKRKWLGGGGRNIPSFEVFTSPDWRGTEGWIKFNQPLYRYGSVVEGIELKFEKGRVVKATANKNQKLLTEMLATDTGASQMGEYSLTDKRLSRITKFMAETLFDENMGGKFGNTHLAVGSSYHDTYIGDITKLSKEDIKKLGYNDSSIHTDMISTTDRTVVATLKDGSTKTIYKNGQFTV
jgi:aminopeptidase